MKNTISIAELIAALPMITKIGNKYKIYFRITFVEIFIEFIFFTYYFII